MAAGRSRFACIVPTQALRQTCNALQSFGRFNFLTTRGTRLNRLAFGGRQVHKSPMDKLQFDRADYSVVVKNRAPPPKAWRWEIYRAGNASSIRQSPIYFDTVMAARRAGKEALKKLLDKLFS